VSRSLRRTLAVRFAATMSVGLLVATAAAYAAALGPAAGMHRDLLLVLAGVVVVGTGATLVGAGWLAGSAVRPVAEITEQATRIEAGTLDQRIAAHADTEEYRELVAVLNRMLERLEQGFQAQRRLTADVGHELRTPLTAVQGLVEVALRAERRPQEYRRVLRSVLEEIEGLTRMGEDLLLISRAESRLVQLRRVPVDPNAVAREALEGVGPQIEEKGLVVEAALDPRAEHVLLDPALARRLVAHLLDNAVKFAPAGGRVCITTVAACPADRGVQFAVENSGPGIPPDDLPHIFDPFYRGDPARSSGSGTGLGLSLVAAIARLHGGEARARNETGGGVRFEVDLPAPPDMPNHASATRLDGALLGAR
jgi:two-component system OmpR family sensor kinase